MLIKSEDPHKTIMAYRATPNELGYSPAQLFLGRKIKTDLPISPQQLAPTWPDKEILSKRAQRITDRNTRNYNRRHRVRTAPAKQPNEPVWMFNPQSKTTTPAVVVRPDNTPRSYWVRSEAGYTLRRNRRHCRQMPQIEARDPYHPANHSPEEREDKGMEQLSTPQVERKRTHRHTDQAEDAPVEANQRDVICSPHTTKSGRSSNITKSGRISNPPDYYGY